MTKKNNVSKKEKFTKEELKKYKRDLKNLKYQVRKDLGLVNEPKPVIPKPTKEELKDYNKWSRRVERQIKKIESYGVYEPPKPRYKKYQPIKKKISYLKGLFLHLQKNIYKEPVKADYNELLMCYSDGGQKVEDIPINPFKLNFIETGNRIKNIENITKLLDEADEWIRLYWTESPVVFIKGMENYNRLVEYLEELSNERREMDYELHKKIEET
jgi:hypothetical protein